MIETINGILAGHEGDPWSVIGGRWSVVGIASLQPPTTDHSLAVVGEQRTVAVEEADHVRPAGRSTGG
jgi:hypothetical protein